MYYFDKFCCICMKKSDLKHLFEVDSGGVSHYNKLTSSIAEMNFKEMNDQRLICGECCVTLNTVYNFRQMCLRSKTNIISQLQTSCHTSGTVRACLKDIKPELIVVKNRGGIENEGSNYFEESNPQIKFQTESYKEDIGFSASVKEECESGDDSFAHEVNEGVHSDVKVEDVEHLTMLGEYSECYMEFNKIEIEEHQLEEVKEEPMSHTETPQDGGTSQADTGTSEKLKRHEKKSVGTELTQNNEGLHQCEICQQSYNGKDGLMNHMQTHSSKTSYECKICKKVFNNKYSLNRHMKQHSSEITYECEICKKIFYRKTYFTQHMKTHSSERPYECETCKKGYNYKHSLIEHMKTHSRKRQYECEICKKTFYKKTYLTQHMKTHSSERPYECELCKKSFYKKSYFNEHMKTHSSERPYECEICKKGYNYKCSLTEHMKTHSSERPYECEICKKGFNDKNHLTRHIMKTSCIWHMNQHSDETS